MLAVEAPSAPTSIDADDLFARLTAVKERLTARERFIEWHRRRLEERLQGAEFNNCGDAGEPLASHVTSTVIKSRSTLAMSGFEAPALSRPCPPRHALTCHKISIIVVCV